MRAPPESFKPITGAPIFAARSMILTIFPAFGGSLSETNAGKIVKIMDLADLSRVCLRQRSAEHGEILSEDVDQAAFDAAVASDKDIAVGLLLGDAKVIAAVCDQLIGLF